MREILSFLILPLTIFWLLIIVAFMGFVFKKKKILNYFISFSLIWILICSTGFIPSLLVNHLENQYPPLLSKNVSSRNQVYILILGAGFSVDRSLSANNRLSVSSLFRLNEGIRLQRSIPGSRIVFSGGINELSQSHADVMAQAANLLGIDSCYIDKIIGSKNTNDEATRFKSSFGSECTLIVVTDAIHMPRTMKIFRQSGFNPVAAPTNYLNRMDLSVHEYAGMLWNMVGGN